MGKTEKDKQKLYITQRDKFLEDKKLIMKLILEHKASISVLEKQIEENIPRTENGSLICDKCGCRSMKYLGRTPQGGLSGGDDVYQCEICGRYNN